MSLVMLFDSQCVLCSGTVRFVLAHERGHSIAFAGTSGEAGRALAARHGMNEADLDASFVLIEGDRALTRSDAALRLARELRAPWSWLGALRLIPRPVRDAAYSWVARHRYRLFGRLDACFLPAPEQRARFLH